jgi:hypothetical protein
MGFHRDVDAGVIRGDGGASVCIMGIMTVNGKAMGFTTSQIINERQVCLLIGYQIMANSYKQCGKGIYGLAAYASGRCDWGRKESEDMVRMGDRWYVALKAAWKRGEWGTEEHPKGDSEYGH